VATERVGAIITFRKEGSPAAVKKRGGRDRVAQEKDDTRQYLRLEAAEQSKEQPGANTRY